MSAPRIASRQLANVPREGDYWEVVGSSPLTAGEALALLGLAHLLARWHRVVAACDGDLEQARGVWAELGRLERRAA